MWVVMPPNVAVADRVVRRGAGAVGGVDAAADERAGAGVAVADRVARGRGSRRTPRSPSGLGISRDDGGEVAHAVRRASPGRADRRAAAGPAADDHRRAGRGGDHQDAGDARPRTRRTGRRGRWPRGRPDADGGVADLAGVRAAAAPPGHVEAVQGPAVRRQGPRRRRALSEPARARGGAVRRREVPDPGAGPHRADPADAARHPRARHPRLQARTAPRASTPRWTSRTGKVIGALHARHRAIEFKQFLQHHRPRGPGRPRRAPRARQLLARTRRRRSSAGCSRTPASSCTSPRPALLAQPRRALVRRTDHQAAQRGTHRSVRALNTDIRAWIKTWNDDPRPYVWTKTADQILESIARYCDRINDSRH